MCFSFIHKFNASLIAALLLISIIESLQAQTLRPGDPVPLQMDNSQALAALQPDDQFTIRKALVSRVKDIAQLEGIQDNDLLGYGLVVGLKEQAMVDRDRPVKLSPTCWEGWASTFSPAKSPRITSRLSWSWRCCPHSCAPEPRLM